MKQSALKSVLFFRYMGIGLDNYKCKESLSRVVVIPKIYIEQLVQKNMMIFLLYMVLEQDKMEGRSKQKSLEIVLRKLSSLQINLLIVIRLQLLK